MPQKHWNEEFRNTIEGQTAMGQAGTGQRQPSLGVMHAMFAGARSA